MEGASSSCQEDISDVVVTKASALFAAGTQAHCAGLGTRMGVTALCQEDPPHRQNPRKGAQHLAPLGLDRTCGESQGDTGTLLGPARRWHGRAPAWPASSHPVRPTRRPCLAVPARLSQGAEPWGERDAGGASWVLIRAPWAGRYCAS